MRPSHLVLIVVGGVGCGGKLLVDSGDLVRACASVADCLDGELCVGGSCHGLGDLCSVDHSHGVCPGGRVCSDGVCTSSPRDWCECPITHACVDGDCAEDYVACAPGGPGYTGACLYAEVCVAGACAPCPETEACSPNNRQGCCPAGAGCFEGFCTPIDDEPCNSTTEQGLCHAGMTCTALGCIVVPCSEEYPYGSCPPDQACRDVVVLGETTRTCEALPCSPGHFGGECPSGEYCSFSGGCILDDTCAVAPDCGTSTQYCGFTSVCVDIGKCLVDQDCPTHYACDVATDVCLRDYDCPGGEADCFDDEHCASDGTCLPEGVCNVTPDCESGDFCAGIGQCIPLGECRHDIDCGGADYCGSQNTCIADGTCQVSADCPPGRQCDGSLACVPTDPTCPGTPCVAGERCSTLGDCIPDDRCTGDADCHASYTCGENYECVPRVPCSEGQPCGPGQRCSVTGGCISNSPLDCAVDADCAEGKVCNVDFACEPGTGCGETEFETSVVPPNMLIVLDRSGSMNECVGVAHKWDAALAAIDEVTLAHSSKVRFGLSTYPQLCAGTGACDSGCNNNCYNACPVDSDPPVGNCNAGVVDVPVGDGTRTAIMSSLNANEPGGNTPTGPTLRNIVSNPSSFRLPDPLDPVVRSNYVMLITDGAANCDGTGAGGKVSGALEQLRSLSPLVTTFVVGFGSGVDPTTLNCNAVYGGTSRCGSYTVANTCSGSGATRTCSCTVNPTEFCGDATCQASESTASCAADCPPTGATLGAACTGDPSCPLGAWNDRECENNLCSKCTANSECGAGGSCTRGSGNSCAHYYCTGANAPAARQGCELPTNAAPPVCYYDAGDAAALSQAFGDIAGQIASCTYSLGQEPPNPDRVYVYLDDGGTLREITRNTADGWDFDVSGNSRIVFSGQSCDDVKAGQQPKVFYGCPEGG
jgi:hypothetical protein